MIDLTTPPSTKVLVVGAGFIGSHICRRLLGDGHQVRVLTRALPAPAHDRLLDGAEVLIGDATDAAAVAAAMTGVQWVVFCAGGLVPAASQSDPIPDVVLALRPLLTVLDAVVRSPGTGLTYLSSGGTVYGRSTCARIPEDHPTDPVTAYGVLKLAGEKFAGLYAGQSAMPIRILRCANVYGEGQRTDRGQGAVAAFLKAMAHGEPITMYGAGDVIRDFVHVSDVAAAVSLLRPAHPLHPLSSLSAAGCEVVNVGSGIAVSLAELLSRMEEMLGAKAAVIRRPSRPFDVERNVLDIERLSTLSGLTPMSLDFGLERTIGSELLSATY
ncbi:MAG TPA: NAD-dependent epimerase/dehydratase family protein [Frankiaceae bacterium]|nr:NAD-dependent epimerase/dehydratase family protein [Frankiaceae bacterium]